MVVTYSEGKLFDIINLKAIDPEQLKVRDAATEGRKAGRKLKYTFEKQNLVRRSLSVNCPTSLTRCLDPDRTGCSSFR